MATQEANDTGRAVLREMLDSLGNSEPVSAADVDGVLVGKLKFGLRYMKARVGDEELEGRVEAAIRALQAV